MSRCHLNRSRAAPQERNRSFPQPAPLGVRGESGGAVVFGSAPETQAPGGGTWDYLFIVTYGRSGSTLLQGVLNTIDGYVIRGENGGAVKELWRYQKTLSYWRAKRKKPVPLPETNAWWGIDGFDERHCARMICEIVDSTILHPPAGTRVAGFKEVRYLEPDTPEYVAWMAETFPASRFILNFRNLDDVAKSAWWQDKPDAQQQLQAADEMLLGISQTLGPVRSHVVRYEQYAADPEGMRPLFAWLDEEFDGKRIGATMARPHSY